MKHRHAEAFADFLGTVRFVVASSVLIVGWIAFNVLEIAHFDQPPFVLLNLVFSAFAFYTGALVIIAQKAQANRDRTREEAAAEHREDLHGQLVELVNQNTALTEQVRQLTEDIHGRVK